MVEEIKGTIIDVTEDLHENWQFIAVGKILGEKENEKYSVSLSKEARVLLCEDKVLELKIHSVTVDKETHMGMMILDSESFLFAGANTIARLASDLHLAQNIGTYPFEKKVALLSKALSGKELFVKFAVPPKVKFNSVVLHVDEFKGKVNMNVIIHET